MFYYWDLDITFYGISFTIGVCSFYRPLLLSFVFSCYSDAILLSYRKTFKYELLINTVPLLVEQYMTLMYICNKNSYTYVFIRMYWTHYQFTNIYLLVLM